MSNLSMSLPKPKPRARAMMMSLVAIQEDFYKAWVKSRVRMKKPCQFYIIKQAHKTNNSVNLIFSRYRTLQKQCWPSAMEVTGQDYKWGWLWRSQSYANMGRTKWEFQASVKFKQIYVKGSVKKEKMDMDQLIITISMPVDCNRAKQLPTNCSYIGLSKGNMPHLKTSINSLHITPKKTNILQE